MQIHKYEYKYTNTNTQIRKYERAPNHPSSRKGGSWEKADILNSDQITLDHKRAYILLYTRSLGAPSGPTSR